MKAGAEAEHRPHARDDRDSKGMTLGKRSERRGGDGECDSEGGKKRVNWIGFSITANPNLPSQVDLPSLLKML